MFDKLLRDLVENIEEPVRDGAGRPALSLKEQLFCSTQKVYSQLSSRRAKSLYDNSKERGFLQKVPHSNSVNKFFNRTDITPILHKLIALSSAPLKTIETDFAIDSSGFRTNHFNDYCKEKHGTQKIHKWLKAHVCCGTKTNIVSSVTITEEYGADSPQFSQLVNQTAKNGFTIKELSADKAYNSRENYETVAEHGGTAFIPFKDNATGKARGSLLWKRMFHYFQFEKEMFLEHYHKRSNVESTFNMIKAKFGDGVKSKNWTAQKNELLAKILCHNIVVVIHEMFELGIEAKFESS